jgi:dienelactone hydrolase
VARVGRRRSTYYPGHGICVATNTDLYPHRGGADDPTAAERSREMVGHSGTDGATIALTVYPGGYHAFDVAQVKPGIRSLGRWLEYSKPAAKDAEVKPRAFLAANLSGAPASQAQTRHGHFPAPSFQT